MKSIDMKILPASLLIFLAAAVSCKQQYDPPTVANPPVFLVVEGFINGGPDSTFFTLSHTYRLNDTSTTTPELGATVTVEGNDNSSYTLPQAGNNGVYAAALPALNPNTRYRLHIITSNNKQYASDYVSVVVNPPIDSVNFLQNNAGVNIYVNSHDPSGKAQYFRWEYQETWEFHAAYYATLLFQNNVLVDYYPNTMYTCWRSDNSSRIIIGNSTALSQDIIYEAPMVAIPRNDQQISIKYSILVKQYAITSDAFAWWSIMQNNTENIGSIFGVQPSTDQGNLHSLTDSTELVIGYVSAGNVTSKRLFITNDQVAPWRYTSDCDSITSHSDSLAYYAAQGYAPIGYVDALGTRVFLSFPKCVDCTLSGTNIQPPFWQ
jgi:hypothetical protein